MRELGQAIVAWSFFILLSALLTEMLKKLIKYVKATCSIFIYNIV